MKYILTLLFLFSFTSAWALPECEGSPIDIYSGNEMRNWNNCVGTIILKNKKWNCINCSVKGEFSNGTLNGLVIEKYSSGIPYFYGL